MLYTAFLAQVCASDQSIMVAPPIRMCTQWMCNSDHYNPKLFVKSFLRVSEPVCDLPAHALHSGLAAIQCVKGH